MARLINNRAQNARLTATHKIAATEAVGRPVAGLLDLVGVSQINLAFGDPVHGLPLVP